MGFFDRLFKRNSELGFMFDMELFEQRTNQLHLKKLSLDMCVSFLARTISQSEFRIRDGDDYKKDELYYKLNTRPSQNTTASTFWQRFVTRLVYDNEVLVVHVNGDLLIADSFQHTEMALLPDTFTNVMIKDYELRDVFKQEDVLHLKFSNERLIPLIDSLFYDYGELYQRVMSGQKRKNQIRGTVDMDMLSAKSPMQQSKLQEFIDNMYNAIGKNDVAIIPQQPGFKYEEKSGNGVSTQSVDEINKVTNGFLEQVAMALGIPLTLLRGDQADVGGQTKSYMFFTVSPLLKKIKDEADVKFFTKQEQLDGHCIDIRKPSYRDLFDLATAVDKLVSSGVLNGDELRSELGYEVTGEEIHQTYFITKNYQDGSEVLEGGEDE